MAGEPRRFGKYEIGEELGRGGTAIVYRARDTNMGLDVALKVLNGHHNDDQAFVEQFQQETRIAANLHHPAIIRLFDFGELDGQVYVAMRLVQGYTLQEWLQERGRLTMAEALPILSQVASALTYLQGRGLVHRDLKPANILLEGEPGAFKVTLADFGLVQSLGNSTKLTRTSANNMIGTPAYFAPEQADSAQWGLVEPKTDVYALGVVSYEMLLGQRPFKGHPLDVIRAHADKVPPSPLEIMPELGEDAAGVLLQGLAKDPQDRYPSATAFVNALQAVQTNRQQAIAREKTLADLIEQAETARTAQQWLTLNRLCSEIAEIDRTYPDLLNWMIEAQQGLAEEIADDVARRQRAELYEAGLADMEAEQWQEAAEKLQEVAESNPDFRDVQAKLAEAQAQLRRSEWFFEAVALDEQEKWAQSAQVWRQLLLEDWQYRDGEAIHQLMQTLESLLPQTDTLGKKSGVQQQAMVQSQLVVSQFDQLLLAIHKRDWQGVIKFSNLILQSLPQIKFVSLASWQTYAEGKIVKQRAKEEARKKGLIVWPKDGKQMALIPGGEFLMGSTKGMASEQNETPQHYVYLPNYYIDCTPVTNAEYAKFMKDGGYKVRKFWKEAEAAGYWEHGTFLAGVSKTQVREPYYWQDSEWNAPQQPVVGVSWYEALAYARWSGKRLPTEAEWEKAARGTNGQDYPWGNTWVAHRANTEEVQHKKTTSVGKYSPAGNSPYGIMDMAGNVWEWCRTRSHSNYPYKTNDGREDLRGGETVLRILRGGSWVNGRIAARCAYRNWYAPHRTDNIIGFRCCATFSFGSGS